MHLAKLAAAFAATVALSFSASANAALLLGSGGSAANTITDYSAPGAVSFDLDLAHLSPTTLRFVIEEDDLLGPLSLNAIVRNLSGAAMNGFRFNLSGISYLASGSVTPAFGTLSGVRYGADYASIAFASPEWAEFHFGNARTRRRRQLRHQRRCSGAVDLCAAAAGLVHGWPDGWAAPQKGLSRLRNRTGCGRCWSGPPRPSSAGDARRSCQKNKVASKIGSVDRQANGAYSYNATRRA
jgi:hypothetical protein